MTRRPSAPCPPERLRIELERHRARGLPFRAAWPAAMGKALRGLPLHAAVEWRTIFGEQRLFWKAAYSPLPSRAKRPAMFLPEHEHFDVDPPIAA